MKRIIAGGTGFIGRHLIKRWLTQGIEIAVIGRDKAKIIALFNNQVNALTWDDVREKPEVILENTHCIINLAGAGIGDRRWTEHRKQEIVSSRIHTTAFLAAICASKGKNSPPLYNTSAIGIYGLQKTITNQLPIAFDENSPIDFAAKPDFLAEVARAWEQATEPAKKAGVHVVNLRFAVVLAKDGGALPKMAKPFYFFMGGRIGSGYQPFSWVSLGDLISAIEFLIASTAVEGEVNIVAPECVTQMSFAKTLAKILKKPCFFHLPSFLIEMVFGQMGKELLLSGQHVKPTRLQWLGFEFQYPKLEQALTEIYKTIE